MHKDKQIFLKRKFPILYEYLPVDNSISFEHHLLPIVFGIECGEGWYDLIYNLSKDLENLHQNLKVIQVKEKYGTLRFYLESDTDESIELISKAEDSSETICEVCGQPGILYTTGWYSVRCNEHKK